MFLRFIFVCLVALFFISCGGGGGGGSSESNQQDETYSLSGTISVAGGSAVDSDINDTSAPYSPNNSFAEAQSIPNPVTVGGYVNNPSTGPNGLLYSGGDINDYFTADLIAGQVITLMTGDQVAGDLDLYLYDDSETLIDSSLGTGQTHSLNVPTGGIYYMRVYASSGYSNYVLSIGQNITSFEDRESLRLSDEFVPGELIVKFKDNSSSVKSYGPASGQVEVLGLKKKSGIPGRAMLLHLGDENQKKLAFQKLGISLSSAKKQLMGIASKEILHKLDTLKVIKSLRKRSDIFYADPNYIRRTFAVPEDPSYSLQWHYPLINLPQAWDHTSGDSNVTVAVIDTGVLLNHPDLTGKLVSGYDFVDKDNDPDDPSTSTLSSFHGTHVAGTAAAATNNNIGVAGSAWNVKIMPVRVLDTDGVGTEYDIMQGVRYASKLSNDSGTVPSQSADVINLSLGGVGFSQSAQDVFTEARNAGVIVVAAAGNSGNNSLSYPASYDGVVSVSAVDIQKNLSYYSSFGSAVDVAAPGGDLRYDINGDGNPDGVLSTHGYYSGGSVQYSYSFLQGTSMATPHVAGVVALMKSVNPNLTPSQFDSMLASVSDPITEDLGSQGWDNKYGHGLIDAQKAVVQAGNLTPGSPILVVNPTSLNFSYNLDSTTISVMNGSGGTLTVNNVNYSASWLSVVGTNIDGNNLGTYTVTVNRGALVDGTYTENITVTSSANTINIPVIMQVNSTNVNDDAGFHYVLLIDPSTFSTVNQASINVNNGTYQYQLTNVIAGNYYIIAGSDLNNNKYICESAEACGAYKTLDQFFEITVNSNQSSLDFFTGYNYDFTSNSGSGILGNQISGRALSLKRR